MARKKPVMHAAPYVPVYPRSDPAALAAFDPKSKVCSMNCGQALGDPRSAKECKFQCDECWPVAASLPKENP